MAIRVLTAIYTDGSGEAPEATTDETALEAAPLVTPEADAAAGDAPAAPEATPVPADAEEPADEPAEDAPAASASVIRAELWRNVAGDDLDAFVKTPQFKHDAPEIVELERLAFPRGSGDSYGVRIRGYLVPPADGDYRFFLSADDRAALWLSTDADPANKIVVAYTPDWTGPEVYDKYPEQATGPLALEAGDALLLRGALQTGGRQGQSLFVAWERPGGEREVIGISEPLSRVHASRQQPCTDE
jgi:hypothetical protein